MPTPDDTLKYVPVNKRASRPPIGAKPTFSRMSSDHLYERNIVKRIMKMTRMVRGTMRASLASARFSLSYSPDQPTRYPGGNLTFCLICWIVSRLSSREQRHARDAVLQRTSLEKLYELSRSTLLLDLHQPPSRQLAQLIYQIFNAAGVALFDADSGQSELVGSWSPEETNLARSVYLQDSGNDDHRTQTYERVLRLGATSIGSLVIRGECKSVTINALASLTEIAFERYRSFEKESRAESASQGEQLRTAVLDALAHAFKTPLTAIRTASSGLLEIAGLTAAQAGLVTLIDDESSMLNDLCTRLLQTAKLEVESLGIRKDEILVSEMVDEVVTECSHRDPSHKLQV